MDELDLTPTDTITDLMVEMCRDGSMSKAISALGDRLERITAYAKALERVTDAPRIDRIRKEHGITDADMEVE